MCKELIVSFDEYDYEENEDYEGADDDWLYCRQIANELLDTKGYVRVEGTTRRWSGTTGVYEIIPETTIEDIIDIHMDIDRIKCEVYKDRIEFSNYHHDGTNSYTFTPFSFEDLTIKELKAMISRDDYNYDRYEGDSWFSNARKYELIEFIEGNL